MKQVLVFCCLVALAHVANAAGFEDLARKALRGSAQERVDIMARSMFAIETLLKQEHKSDNVTQAQQDHLIQTIQEQIAKVQSSMSQIEVNQRENAAEERQETKTGLDKKLKNGKTWKQIQKMRDFRNRLNRRSRLGALDFISKLKNAVHFIKKGALNGDEKADAGFMASLARAGQMLGH